MSATKITGAMRPDGLIELTGTAAQFRTVLRQAGVRLATLDLPDQEAEEDAHPFRGLLPWRKAGRMQLALITQRDFAISTLAAWVEFPRGQAAVHEAEIARKTGTLLKTLLLDRRHDGLSLERMADIMQEKLGILVGRDTLHEVLAGALPLRPGVLTAMLITLHVYKALSPGSVAEFTACLTGHPAGKAESGLAGLLKFPHTEVTRAFYGKKIGVTEEGGVTLAGVTVTPDITIFFPETEAAPPSKRPWTNRQSSKPRGDLRQVSRDDPSQSAA